MKLILFFTFVAAVYCTVSEEKTYPTKYDKIDIEDILKNDRLLGNYVDCLLEKGPCTPDGLELRKHMPDAIETECSKCTETQKNGSDKIIQFLIDHKPELWKPLQEKYDPTGSYKTRYLENKSDVASEPVV